MFSEARETKINYVEATSKLESSAQRMKQSTKLKGEDIFKWHI